jgi:LuxR family transcriptional regulator, maltose regulon positive regulatory protein
VAERRQRTSTAAANREPAEGPRRRRLTAQPGALPPSPLAAIVESKIEAPRLQSGLVSRTALVNRLRAETFCPLVVIVAPAGYGKTTLLAQWAARDPRPFAWVSVDERDNDPIVLLRHVAAALDAIEPLAPHVLEGFEARGAPASMWTHALPRLARVLADAEPLVLVLDDMHLLRSKDSLDAVEVLSANVGAGSAVAVSARVAPRLPIPALRASGRLVEVGVEQLALTTREGDQFLRSAVTTLSFDEATKLVTECEGWPAALSLTALSLRESRAEPPGASAPPDAGEASPFAARDANLTAYFRSEYLSRLRPDTVRFLRRTSILEELCGGLCDAVGGEEGSARMLERIAHSNLFVVPLDRDRLWYRYHRLFRDALRRELAEREPDALPVLHRRAADWYQAHDDPESALDHAAAGGDFRRVAHIFTRIALPLYHGGRIASVERWLARFDDPLLLERYPLFALHGSWIHAQRGRTDDAERWLGLAETGLARGRPSRDGTTWIKAIRAVLCNDGVYQMIADAEGALAGMSRDHPVRPSALLMVGAGYMLLGQNGGADARLAEAAAEAGRVGATDTEALAIAERSTLAAAENDTDAAERLANQARQAVEKGHLEGYATTALTLATSARAALRHGDWDAARADLERAAELTPSLSRGLFPWLAVQTHLEVARVYLALRETPMVRSLLTEIRELLHERPHVGVLIEQADELEREVEAVADSDGARAALTPAELRLLPYLTTHLTFREIGEELYVSRNTIKTQAISVYRKLGVTSRSDAIKCAVELGLVAAEAPSA